MRNNFKKILLIIFFKILFLLPVLSDDFIFKVTEIEVSDSGNKYKGINGGTITSKDNLKIISDTFEYDKSTNIIEAYGNVLIVDKTKNITIETNKVFYLKNEEIIFTEGKSKAIDGNGLIITADDEFRFNRLKNILSSSKTGGVTIYGSVPNPNIPKTISTSKLPEKESNREDKVLPPKIFEEQVDLFFKQYHTILGVSHELRASFKSKIETYTDKLSGKSAKDSDGNVVYKHILSNRLPFDYTPEEARSYGSDTPLDKPLQDVMKLHEVNPNWEPLPK